MKCVWCVRIYWSQYKWDQKKIETKNKISRLVWVRTLSVQSHCSNVSLSLIAENESQAHKRLRNDRVPSSLPLPPPADENNANHTQTNDSNSTTTEKEFTSSCDLSMIQSQQFTLENYITFGLLLLLLLFSFLLFSFSFWFGVLRAEKKSK